jgi:N-sulfoglucosamine sulfohydrolase
MSAVKPRTFRTSISMSLAVAAVLVVGSTAEAQRPNFILMIADDMGMEALAYGHPTIRTPNLERLAQGGMRFDRAFVTTSSCSPSRASIITGRYPHSTGAKRLHEHVPEEQLTFVELLGKAGYWTASAGKWHLGQHLTDRFDLVLTLTHIREAAREAGTPHVSGTEDWLGVLRKRPRDQPFFLWFASFDPHREYFPGAIDEPHSPESVTVPPYLTDTPSTRADLAMYYDEVSRLDGAVGDVLDELERQGIADNTIVLFISDNGMPFPRAKTTMYDAGIQTPFIFSWPAQVRPGRISGSLVSTVDIAPTFLELAGVPRPPSFQGVSLVPLLEDPGKRVREHIFAEKNWHDFEDRSRAARSERYKYIRNYYPDLPMTPAADALTSPAMQSIREERAAGRLTTAQASIFVTPRSSEELYDVWEDPFELNNLAEDPRYTTVLADLRNALDRWQRTTNDTLPPSRTPDGFDRETGERLPDS